MNIKNTFRVIEEKYHNIWSEEAEARKPFMPSTQVSMSPWRHSTYSGSVIDNDGMIWSKKSGLTTPGTLIKTSTSGEETRVLSFAYYSSELRYDKTGDRIWWSETLPDRRWTLGGSSRIRYIDLEKPGKVQDLTKTGKYFNPSPSRDGKRLSVTEYPSKGGSKLVIISALDGSVEKTFVVPDSIQVTESAWAGERLFAAGLSDKGMGIYEIGENGITKILGPEPVTLASLRQAPELAGLNGPGLTFVSDRSGVSEMYLLNIGNGDLTQVTSTRYGISSPVFNAKADTLFFSSLAPSDDPEASRQGWMIHATPSKYLPMMTVRFNDIHRYPVADSLSAQEKVLAGKDWDLKDYPSETSFSDPVKYRKFTPVAHSWAPIYFNYDNVETISADEYYKTSSLGATVLLQNLVGDGYGFVGYGAHADPDLDGPWRHSGHFKYIYNGLYPVLELSADIGDRSAMEICRVQQEDKEKKKLSFYSDRKRTGEPYFEGSLRAYIPFNFSSGGITRGFIPQVKVRVTNDLYNDKISLRRVISDGEDSDALEIDFLGQDKTSPLGSVDISLRGYSYREKAPSQVYPGLGIGVETGFRSRPGLSGAFGNSFYLYTYGYLPGILQNQGIRLSAIFGKELGGNEFSYPDIQASAVPRGFVNSTLKSLCNSCSPERYRFTFDYAIPILNLDWSWLSPIAYIKNIQVTPFFDCALLKFKYSSDFRINYQNVSSDFIFSAGADFSVNLGNLLWLPHDCGIGVRYARNSWTNLEKLRISGLEKDYIGVIFDISL